MDTLLYTGRFTEMVRCICITEWKVEMLDWEMEFGSGAKVAKEVKL